MSVRTIRNKLAQYAREAGAPASRLFPVKGNGIDHQEEWLERAS